MKANDQFLREIINTDSLRGGPRVYMAEIVSGENGADMFGGPFSKLAGFPNYKFPPSDKVQISCRIYHVVSEFYTRHMKNPLCSPGHKFSE